MSKEAMKLALEALELHGKQYPHMVKGYCLDAITAIKQALAASDLQAELDATNRQVEILSDALAKSRREIDAMIAIARADEREACAKVCDLHCADFTREGAEVCAAEIRARKNT